MGRICNPEREAHVLYEAPFSKYTAKCALQFQQRSWGPWSYDLKLPPSVVNCVGEK